MTQGSPWQYRQLVLSYYELLIISFQAANQYLLQRQLFSDMERQQVREVKRRAEHNKKVRQLRELKELERQRIEQAEAEKIGFQDSPSSEVRQSTS